MKSTAEIPALLLAFILSIGILAAWVIVVLAGVVLFAPHRDIPESNTVAGACFEAILVPGPIEASVHRLFLLPLSNSARVLRHPTVSASSQFSYWFEIFFACSLIPLVMLGAVSTVLATWCYRRHRRYSQNGALAWALFVFLFGAPSLAGYLLHRRWSVTEKCQHCGEVTPRDRDACLHCDTEFPLPALKGIEIFA